MSSVSEGKRTRQGLIGYPAGDQRRTRSKLCKPANISIQPEGRATETKAVYVDRKRILVNMSSVSEGKRTRQGLVGYPAGDQRRTRSKLCKPGSTSTEPGGSATETNAVCFDRKRDTSEYRAENENREIEIREHVFSVSIPGVEITHCNFGKSRVEIWYTAGKTEGDTLEEELQRKIRSIVRPYTLKLVKKPGPSTFRYTSPGQSIRLERESAGSIGAYVTLKENDDSKPHVHVLVSGHGKAPGDVLHCSHNPDLAIGEVKVAKHDIRKRYVASGGTDYQLTNSVDVGLVEMVKQQLDHHETFVTTNEFGRVHLARAEAIIHPSEMEDDHKVMLFNNHNKQGTVCYQNYNSRHPQKFGMIAIAQQPGENRRAVHGMNESGTLVVGFPPYTENGTNLVQAVGMLVGIEEFQQSPESISLAVPIGANLQELQEDAYCVKKEIQFA